MKRARQVLLLTTFPAWCWLAMMGVHELGHVLGGLASGGSVERVVWHPLAISRTDFSVNPHPALAAWCGPLFGAAAPFVCALLAKALHLPGNYLVRFFAGFCLIANGAYIGGGSFDGVGDAGDLLRGGSPMWTLWLFGLAATVGGLWCWHGLGAKFGLGKQAEETPPVTAYISCTLLALTAAASFLL